MSQPDANPTQSSTAAKPPADKPKSETTSKPEKSADWGSVGGLFLALLGLIIVIGNATGFGESPNQSSVFDQNQPEFNEVDFNPNNSEENNSFEFSDPIEPEFPTIVVNHKDFSPDPNNSLPYIPSNIPCLKQPIHPPPPPVKKH